MSILIGSKAFFDGLEGFEPHDNDTIEIIETEEFEHIRQRKFQGDCYFHLRKKPSAQDYIQWDVKHNVGMAVGKYLVPQFAEEINLSFEELKLLQPLIDRLDAKHDYERIIYESYLSNGDFTLTEQQRLEAYNSYRTSRGLSTVD